MDMYYTCKNQGILMKINNSDVTADNYRQLYWLMDKNKDGMVEKKELLESTTIDMYEKIDQDNDGKIAIVEYENYLRLILNVKPLEKNIAQQKEAAQKKLQEDAYSAIREKYPQYLIISSIEAGLKDPNNIDMFLRDTAGFMKSTRGPMYPCTLR
eukprot:TRINITY_DN19028_c0_g1_i1.p1 TRINITY_DN19028_c0_g1~~TRINITY_DN19028_c0_g1_i1.p1  ORF type:complete len:155 (+),score=17.32 TRINITY_DN19028_c0_g1_i1:379-843(+)